MSLLTCLFAAIDLFSLPFLCMHIAIMNSLNSSCLVIGAVKPAHDELWTTKQIQELKYENQAFSAWVMEFYWIIWSGLCAVGFLDHSCSILAPKEPQNPINHLTISKIPSQNIYIHHLYQNHYYQVMHMLYNWKWSRSWKFMSLEMNSDTKCC